MANDESPAKRHFRLKVVNWEDIDTSASTHPDNVARGSTVNASGATARPLSELAGRQCGVNPSDWADIRVTWQQAEAEGSGGNLNARGRRARGRGAAGGGIMGGGAVGGWIRGLLGMGEGQGGRDGGGDPEGDEREGKEGERGEQLGGKGQEEGEEGGECERIYLVQKNLDLWSPRST
ncbi:unnamed protein product [Closterium sp. NIES-53]